MQVNNSLSLSSILGPNHSSLDRISRARHPLDRFHISTRTKVGELLVTFLVGRYAMFGPLPAARSESDNIAHSQIALSGGSNNIRGDTPCIRYAVPPCRGCMTQHP